MKIFHFTHKINLYCIHTYIMNVIQIYFYTQKQPILDHSFHVIDQSIKKQQSQ
jgi:hypothetical protein